MEKKFVKKSCKIGKNTFWVDEEYNYTLHSQNLNDAKVNGKRKTNLYRWDPKYTSILCGKHNIEDCDKEIIMRAFITLYPDVKEYEAVYNSMYCSNTSNTNVKETVTNNANTVTNNATINILIKALRQQAEMFEDSLKKQAEMNNAHVEEIINIATSSNAAAADSNNDVDITTDSTDAVADTIATADNTNTIVDSTTVNNTTNTVDHNTVVQEEPKKQSSTNTIEVTIDDDVDEEIE